MIDNPEIDPLPEAQLEKPGQDIPGDFAPPASAIKVNERQSYEQVIEGLKRASDGCRNLAAYFNREQWDTQADVFDKIRQGIAKLAGIGRATDETPSEKKWGGEALTRNDSYNRVYDGLTKAAGGMLQIATGHRGDLRWSKIAFMAYSLRDTAGKLIRAKKRGKLIGLN